MLTELVSTATVLVAGVVVLLIYKRRRSAKDPFLSENSNILSVSGKTVLVTGASSGIGYETALELARRGARVILACRNMAIGERAASSIRQKTSNNNVVCYTLDLVSMDSIQVFSEKVLSSEPRVDILINNAGVMFPGYCPTADGLELHMGVNHLGHFLLTLLLLQRLKDSAPSRIINVTSLLYKQSKEFDFELMNSRDESRMSSSPSSHRAYSQSKLAGILFTTELSRRLKGTGVVCNAVSPGVVNTGLSRHLLAKLPFLIKPLAQLVQALLFKTPYQGAIAVVHCAIAEESGRMSGRLYRDCAVLPLATTVSQDTQIAKKLWDVSAKMVNIEHRVQNIQTFYKPYNKVEQNR